MIVDRLIELLEEIENVDCVIRQGTLSANEKYPNLFITFWENESDDGNHYDDFKTSTTIYDFDINVYGSNVGLVYETILKIKQKLIQNNFLVNGTGYDVASDETTHIGRGINTKYVE